MAGTERRERTTECAAHRAGRYERKLTTTAGKVTIYMPKLKGARFTIAIIKRCRGCETRSRRP